MMHTKQTLVFDFDGTIADTLPRLLVIGNRLSAEFGYRQLPDDAIELFRGKRTKEALEQLRVPMARLPAIALRIRRELQKEIHLLKPIDSVKEVLRELAPHYRLGIVTSNSSPNVNRFLEANEMLFFDFVHSSSSVFGKSRVLRSVLRARRLKKEETVYVGDETRDVDAAQKSGIDMIAVAWGANSADVLASLQPRFLIHHPHELLRILQKG